MFAGQEIHGSTLGIIGMGRIGQGIARRGALGFGMQVIYHNRQPARRCHRGAMSGHAYVSKQELLQSADHVVLVVPYSAASHHTIGAAELARMKPTAILVNIARGGIVDDAALAAGAARGSHRWRPDSMYSKVNPRCTRICCELPNVVLTPHIASATVATRKAMADLAADNLIRFLTEGRPVTALNPQIVGAS